MALLHQDRLSIDTSSPPENQSPSPVNHESGQETALVPASDQEQIQSSPSYENPSSIQEYLRPLDDETDLGQLLASDTFEGFLSQARKLIIERARISSTVVEKCSYDIARVWAIVQEQGKLYPQLLQEFENQVDEQIRSISNRSLKEWLVLGKSTQERIEKNGRIVEINWGCKPMCILSQDRYAKDQPLSRASLKELADLSVMVSADEGRQLLSAEIDKRALHVNGRGRHSYANHLIHRDITQAIQKARQMKLEEATRVAGNAKLMRPKFGTYKMTTDRKRKRLPILADSVSLDDSPRETPERTPEPMPGQISDETSDQTQQDHPNKKRNLGSQSVYGRMMNNVLGWKPGHRKDVDPLNQQDRMPNEGFIRPSDSSATHHREDDLPGEGLLGHLDGSITHRREDDVPGGGLFDQLDGTIMNHREDDVPGEGLFGQLDGTIIHHRENDVPDKDLLGPRDSPATSNQEGTVADEKLLDHQIGVVPHQQDTKTTDNELQDHQNGSLHHQRDAELTDNELADHLNGPAPSIPESDAAEEVHRNSTPQGGSVSDGNETWNETARRDEASKQCSAVAEPAEVLDNSSTMLRSWSDTTTLYENLDTGSMPNGNDSYLLDHASPLRKSTAIDGVLQPAITFSTSSPTVISVPSSSSGSLTSNHFGASSEILTTMKGPITESEERCTIALTTLEPKQYISSEIISTVLYICAPSNCYVVDPLFVDPQFKSTSTQRVRKSLSDDISTVVVPLHHTKQSHWTVVIFQRADTFAEHLDSYPSLESKIDLDNFHHCMRDIDKEYKNKIISYTQCPVQPNGYDCGVQVLANALHYMGGIKAPLTHDCGLWRRLCRALISHNVDKVSNKPIDIINCSAESKWKKVLYRDAEKRHQTVENDFTKLRSEVEEILRIGNLLTSLFELNNSTQSSFCAEIKDIRNTRESLCGLINGAGEQTPVILKYASPDCVPPIRGTLTVLEQCIAKLEGRLNNLRNCAKGIQAAQWTLDGVHTMYTQQWADLETALFKWGEAAKNQRDEIKAEVDWVQRMLTLFANTNL